MAVMDIAIILSSLLLLAYFEVPVLFSIPIVALILVGMTFVSHGHLVILSLFWLVFLAATVFLAFSPFRRRYITNRLIEHLQHKMPSISATERDAIEAGDVWWEKELFSGRPHWKNLLDLPVPKLAAAEQAFLDNQVKLLCSMLDDWQIAGELHDLPEPVWQFLKRERFFGMIIPEGYGGLGFSAMAHSSVVTQIATRSVSAAFSIMVPNSLGPAELLLHYGTEEQKSYYLPRLACGEDIPCFALTGPEAGSDAGAIPDTGVICRGMHKGQEITGIRLNWDKRYITLAPIATVIGLAVRLYDPDNLLGRGTAPGITLCLVAASCAGIENGRRHNPLHLAFMNGPTRGKDVFVPLDAIIGGTEMVGEGWRMLMECLSIGRGISLPALSTACGQVAYRMTGGYARLRRQFNVPIASFEGVSEALGNIAGMTYMLEACRQLTATAVAQNIRPAIASAITKYQLTEMARKVVSHAMDVHGGHGIQMGPENFLANLWLAIPVCITVEGANILTRNLIIFGQGAIRCHPFLLEEIAQFCASPSAERSRKLDKLLFAHAGRVASLLVRNLWCGLTGGRWLVSRERGETAGYFRQLTRMSCAFALLSDMTLMLLGGELKRSERLSARLGDILGQLYLASAVLKYFHNQEKPETDLDYIRWCVTHCLTNIQRAIEDILDNYPSAWLGKALRWLIFPFGRTYRAPGDALHARLAESMIQPSALRDRLTHLFCKSDSTDDAVGRIDLALRQIALMEPLIKKIDKARRQGELNGATSFEHQLQQAVRLHLLTEGEADRLRQYNSLYRDVIRVDEFSPDLASVLTWEPCEWKEEVV